MPTIAQIGAIPLFEGLPDEHLADLACIAVERNFQRGETIFSEGEPGVGFYVALAGRVKIFKLSSDGREQILHLFGPGEPFGEVPVFEGRSFPAHAVAMEECRLCFFPRGAFVQLIGRHPSLALNMLAILSRRLRRFTMLVEELSLKEVPGRLAAHLLLLSQDEDNSDRVRLDVPKNQLAGMLGTIPETLSRILNRMIQQEFIRMEGSTITLADRAGLEELADGTRRLA